MTKQSEAVLAKCVLNEKYWLDISARSGSHIGPPFIPENIKNENARLLPIIRTLLEVNERLSEACELLKAGFTDADDILCAVVEEANNKAIEALAFRDERMKSLVGEE